MITDHKRSQFLLYITPFKLETIQNALYCYDITCTHTHTHGGGNSKTFAQMARRDRVKSVSITTIPVVVQTCVYARAQMLNSKQHNIKKRWNMKQRECKVNSEVKCRWCPAPQAQNGTVLSTLESRRLEGPVCALPLPLRLPTTRKRKSDGSCSQQTPGSTPVPPRPRPEP